MTAPAECVLSPFLFDASNFDSHVRYLIALTSSAPVAQMTSIFHESPLAIKSLSLRHSPQRLLVNETKAKGLRLADLMNRNHCCCLICCSHQLEGHSAWVMDILKNIQEHLRVLKREQSLGK